MLEVHVCARNGALLRAFALGDAEEVIVGRDDACDIRINAPTISREHCCIERNGNGELYIRDLGSTTGTFSRGEKIDRLRVQEGMTVEIGPAVLKFYDGDL